MSAPLTFSAELTASIRQMKARTWRDADAQAFEQGSAPTKPVSRSPMAPLASSVRPNRFLTRQRPRSPDRKASRDRRRTLGSSSSTPPALRALFTEGERAVLAIVAGEVKHHGICDLPYDQIAALAGVCRTTVQTAMHEARRLGLINITERPRPGRKNLTNVIRIVTAEWLIWLKRGPTAHRPPPCLKSPSPLSHRGGTGSNSVKMVSTTKNTDLKKKSLAMKKANLTLHTVQGQQARDQVDVV
jgi:hypothetical protein